MNNKFQVYLIIGIISLFLFMAISEKKELLPNLKEKLSISTNVQTVDTTTRDFKNTKTLVIFYQPSCHSCMEEKKYIESQIKPKYKQIKFEHHDITKTSELKLMESYYTNHKIDLKDMATPSIFIGNDFLLGYERETSNQKIEAIIDKNLSDSNKNNFSEKKILPKYVETPFGKINIFETSLPLLTVALGLLDGFNPCAMWVLVYLITLVSQLNDRSKIWLIVGSFVFASGVLYFLFMTAMLNIFLFIGYLRLLQLAIGCFAIYLAINDLKTYFFSRNEIACHVGNEKSKQKTMTKIKNIVESKMTVMTFFAIIGLAFVVNSIEFLCSAALPAIYTSVLAHAKLSLFKYYSYIAGYVFFFMLDDLIIFSLAVFAIDKYIGDKYVVQCKLIAGIILLILGILLVFFPQFLR